MHLAHKFLLSLALLGPVAGHTQDKAPFNLQELAPGVYAAIDREGRAGANAGIVIGRDAVLVVDSLYKEAASQALLAAVRKLSSLPIRYLVNTHHHIDHVAGNRLFADSGATVVAQRNVAGWIQSENLRLLGGEQASPAAQAQVANLLQPQLSFDRRMSLDLGGRRVELQHQLGHTGGDTVVWVPDAQVMFLGDLLWRRSIPNLIDADLPNWRSTLAALSLQPDTIRFVPGHGGVASSDDLREFATYLEALEHTVAATEGPAETRSAQALEALKARYAAWAYFKGLAAANVRDALAAQAGTKRVPPQRH